MKDIDWIFFYVGGVLIDDNIERALIPAKKFGMTTVWYRRDDREKQN